MWGVLMDVSLGKDVGSAIVWLMEECKSDIESLESKAADVTAFFQNGISDKEEAGGHPPSALQGASQLPPGTGDGDADMGNGTQGGDASANQESLTEGARQFGPPLPPQGLGNPSPPADGASGSSLDPTGLTGPLTRLSSEVSDVEEPEPPAVRKSGRKTKLPQAFTAVELPAQPAAPKKRKVEAKAPSSPVSKNSVDSFWDYTLAFVRNAVSHRRLFIILQPFNHCSTPRPSMCHQVPGRADRTRGARQPLPPNLLNHEPGSVTLHVFGHCS